LTSEQLASYVTLALHPEESQREFAVVIHNRSRSRVDLTLRVPDPEEGLRFQFDWEKVLLESGGTAEAGLLVQAGPHMRKGSRHPFGVTALSDGEVVATASASFVVPGRTLSARLAITVMSALAVAAIMGIGVAMLCPTILRKVCPAVIPDNPLSGLLASPTASSTEFPTPRIAITSTPVHPFLTPTPSPLPTLTLPPPTMTSTETKVPTPNHESSVLTYRIHAETGESLLARTGLGEPITLVDNVDQVMVLDYTRADGGKVAARVVDEGEETLWIISTDGTPVRSGIYQGWQSVKDARWAPDGSWLVVEADIPGLTTYYIYDGLDGALLAQPPLFPRTQTPTLTNTPTLTQTMTITVTSTKTPMGTDILTLSATATEAIASPG